MTTVKWMKYKNYSGPSISGTVPFLLDKNCNHWDRVVWLTSKVESGGKFGAVIMYDGTGLTAGLTQCIALYPREIAEQDDNAEDDQGPLWKLIERVRSDCPEVLQKLDEELKEVGWNINHSSILVHSHNGTPVSGRKIREEFTPGNGRVPRFGKAWQEAKGWALIFHNIFVEERTFDTQVAFGAGHAVSMINRRPKATEKVPLKDRVYLISELDAGFEPRDQMMEQSGDPLDLAMCVWHSHSVNAPAIAFSRFQQAWKATQTRLGQGIIFDITNTRHRELLAKRILRLLGTSTYGRWNWSIKSGRYQRTRSAAMKCGYWAQEYFVGGSALMPKSL